MKLGEIGSLGTLAVFQPGKFQNEFREMYAQAKSSPPLLPQPRAAVPTHPVPPAPPLTGSDEDNSFAQLLSLCVPESDLLRLCERASALWHRTRCFNDPRWTDFCYGCGEPPVSQSELQAASDIFHFLQLAAHEKNI